MKREEEEMDKRKKLTKSIKDDLLRMRMKDEERKKQYQRDLVEPTSSDDGTLLDLDNYSDSREQGNDPNSPDINKKEINEDNDAMLKKLEDDRMHREEQLKNIGRRTPIRSSKTNARAW